MATDSALTFYSYFCFGHGFPSQNVPDGQLSFTVLVYRVLHSSRPRCFVNSAGVQRARFFGKWDSMEITKGNQRGSEIPCHPIFGDRFSPFSFLLRASLGRPRPCCGFFVVFSSLLIRPITRLMHLVLTFHDDCHVLSRVLVILLVCRLLSWFFFVKNSFFLPIWSAEKVVRYRDLSNSNSWSVSVTDCHPRCTFEPFDLSDRLFHFGLQPALVAGCKEKNQRHSLQFLATPRWPARWLILLFYIEGNVLFLSRSMWKRAMCV